MISNLIKSLFFISIFSLFMSQAFATSWPVPTAPQVSAKGFLIQDFHSGMTLAESNANQRMEPASITKLMTTYIIFSELKEGRLKLDEMVRISKKAWRMEGSRTFVEVNSTVSVETLLKGIIVQSGNDATVALAEHIAGSEETFASLMNQTAQKIGMKFTHYVNSTGWPHPEHYTTAKDIALLARTMIREHPEYYSYYSEKEFEYNGIKQHNRNRLLWRDKTVDGIKTGHTESAGYCLVSSAKRDDMRLITVVLGDKSEEARAISSQSLLNYGFRFFETRKLYSAGENLKQVRIWKGDREMLPLGLAEDLNITFPRGKYSQLVASMDLKPRIMAPAKKGRGYGTFNISLDNIVIAEKPLVALQSVEEGGLWTRISDEAQLFFQ
ncbi:MAG: D-alanyl-D-alanine carboxypeptidase [Gammaproteobacteria bacterium]|nr:D-alanyl-D-alanine carboxypeptidase [Gammaproteobacteria bacterium]